MEYLLKSTSYEVRLSSTGPRKGVCCKMSKTATSHLYENKDDKASCNNHEGISLFSIARKILAQILLNRIFDHQVDSVVTRNQCSFRKNRRDVDMVFAVRELQEKYIEPCRDLYLPFVYPTKAFDTINR
jgi:hypothetical protein